MSHVLQDAHDGGGRRGVRGLRRGLVLVVVLRVLHEAAQEGKLVLGELGGVGESLNGVPHPEANLQEGHVLLLEQLPLGARPAQHGDRLLQSADGVLHLRLVRMVVPVLFLANRSGLRPCVVVRCDVRAGLRNLGPPQ